MTFGSEMVTNIDLVLKVRPDTPTSVQQYISDLIKNLEIAQQVATENMEEHKSSYKKAYDKMYQTQKPNFYLGQRVMLQNQKQTPGLPPKLNQKYSGPYYICEVLEKTHTHTVYGRVKTIKCFQIQCMPHV